MLVIVNPYATTVSDRLATSSSTRCRAATTSRPSTPRRRDHATALAARPRARATTSSSPSAATGRSTRWPTASPGSDDAARPACPAAPRTSCARCSGSPARSSTRPSTCCAWPTTGVRAHRPRMRQRAPLHVLQRLRAGRQRRQARRPAPALKHEPAPVLLRLRGGVDVHAPLPRASAAARAWTSTAGRFAASRRSCRTATRSPTSTTGRCTSPRAPSSTEGRCAGVVLRRANPIDVPTVPSGSSSTRASIVKHRRIDAFDGATELRCAPSTAARSRVQVDGDHIGDCIEAVYALRPGGLARRRLSRLGPRSNVQAGTGRGIKRPVRGGADRTDGWTCRWTSHALRSRRRVRARGAAGHRRGAGVRRRCGLRLLHRASSRAHHRSASASARDGRARPCRRLGRPGPLQAA